MSDGTFSDVAPHHMLWMLIRSAMLMHACTDNTCFSITKTHLVKYREFYHQKNENVQIKILVVFIFLRKT